MQRSTKLGLIVFSIAAVCAIVLGEGTLRLAAAVNPALADGLRAYDPTAVQIEPHGVLGYRQRPNATFHYRNGVNATSNGQGFRGPEVPPHPAPGTVRILLFGGSTSHGWEVADDQTIDAHMRSILHERFPDRQFEVVNLAFDGYDSYQDLQRLQSDGLGLDPSIIILNTGINDVRNAWFPNLHEADPRTLIWEDELRRLRAEQQRGGPTLWTRVKHYSFLARTPGYVRGQMERRRMDRARKAAAVAAATAPSTAGAATAGAAGAAGAEPSKAPYPDAADFFDRHVRAMADSAFAHGSAVLLSTPPSALRWYPDTTTSAQSYWVDNAKVTQAYRDELSRRMVAIDSEDAKRGAAIRYVAAAIPPTMFIDDCHLTGEGNRVIAAAFVDAITPLIPPLGGKSGSGGLGDMAPKTGTAAPPAPRGRAGHGARE